MEASYLVAQFGMSPSEERQFRLNLEDKIYSAVLFDEVTYSALNSTMTCRVRQKAKGFLTRAIGDQDRALEEIYDLLPGTSTVVKAGFIALAVAAGANPNNTSASPLDYAIYSGSSNLVARLLDLGADPSTLSFSLWRAIQRAQYSIVELLFTSGSQINRLATQYSVAEWFFRPESQINRLATQTTPLGIAASVGDCQLINFFLDHGADPNVIYEVTDYYRFHTPLQQAIEREDRSAVDLLLKRGSDPNAYNVTNALSPFMLALRCEDISFAHLMLVYGADWRTCNPRAVSMLPLERFEWFVENSGYSPNDPAPEGESLLEMVTALGDEKKISVLVRRGALPTL